MRIEEKMKGKKKKGEERKGEEKRKEMYQIYGYQRRSK
jgi:hypothetical protein